MNQPQDNAPLRASQGQQPSQGQPGQQPSQAAPPLPYWDELAALRRSVGAPAKIDPAALLDKLLQPDGSPPDIASASWFMLQWLLGVEVERDKHAQAIVQARMTYALGSRKLAAWWLNSAAQSRRKLVWFKERLEEVGYALR